MTFVVTQKGSARVASGTAKTLSTMSITPVAGRAFFVYAQHEAALTGTLSITDSGGNTWVEDHSSTTPLTQARKLFRCSSIGTPPTTITVTSTAGGTLSMYYIEATGLDTGAPLDTVTVVGDASATTSHSVAFSATNSNCLALSFSVDNTGMGALSNLNGYTETTLASTTIRNLYNEDIGAAGSKTLSYTSASSRQAYYVIATYKAAVTDPTVSTVSSPTATEGSSLAFLITLSGATNRSTDYAYTLTGTATSADYTSTLTTAMCDNSVTVSGATDSGGTFTVPSGVSSFTVTVPTTSDTIDEADETVILNLPGSVSGTGTITDDDAPPTFSVTDASENAMQVTFTGTLSQASGKTITIDYASANGVKTAGTDYTAATGTLTFSPGETTKTVTVAVL